MPKVTRKPAPDRDSFVERLKKCETRAGGQSVLARGAGIKQSTIRGYSARRTEPPRDVLVLLANAANVSIDWLVTGKGKMERDEPATPNHSLVEQDSETRELAIAISKRYSVPVDFALSRLTGSDELAALEDAMKEWSRSRPIPVFGGTGPRVWGVLSQETVEATAPGSKVADIGVYRLRRKIEKTSFLPGDWALVDSSKEIAPGLYCVVFKSTSSVEIREITMKPGMITLSSQLDAERFGPSFDYTDKDSLQRIFTILGRLVGAIRFVAGAQDGKP